MKEKYKMYRILIMLLAIYIIAAVIGQTEQQNKKEDEQQASVEQTLLTVEKESIPSVDIDFIKVGGHPTLLYQCDSNLQLLEEITENEVEDNSAVRYSNYSKHEKNPLSDFIKKDCVIYDDEIYLEPHEVEEEVVLIEEEPYYQVWSIYTCNNYYTMDEDLQKYMYNKLDEYGITYLMPYLIAQAWQESRYQSWEVVNHGNGVCDCGLFMFRNIYWDYTSKQYLGVTGLDIMNPYNQIDLIVARDYNWICRGYSLEQIIAYHYTSEYVSYIKWDYYNLIIGWYNKEVQLK